jgi:hypothetical protein
VWATRWTRGRLQRWRSGTIEIVLLKLLISAIMLVL